MSYRTLLTVLSPDAAEADLRMAAGLAEEIGAHLGVLLVSIAEPPPIGSYAALVTDTWLKQREERDLALAARSTDIADILAPLAVSADVGAEQPEAGWADELIGRRARYADLTVIGPETLADAALRQKVVEGVLFSSGRPLLVVPPGAKPTLKPRTVMIAWDSRIEASRAMREALPLLAGGEVHIVLVDPEEGEDAHGAEPGADAAAYLARHGARVTVDRLPSEGHSVATILRRHATDCGAELLVMGGYGHSRLRERIFGGVTRSMIEQPALPTLLAR